jgi:hypothetical protein
MGAIITPQVEALQAKNAGKMHLFFCGVVFV